MQVVTGSEIGSGTDSTVTINIFGIEGKSTGIITLDEKNCTKGTHLFETSGLDEFTFQAVDIGKV